MILSFSRRLRGLSLVVASAMMVVGTVAHASEASVARLLAKKYPTLTNVQPHAIAGTGLYEVTIAGQTAYTDEKVTYILVGGELLTDVGGKIRNLTRASTSAAAPAVAAQPAPVVSSAPVTAGAAPMPKFSGLAPHNVPNAKASPHGPLKVLQKQSTVYDTLPFDKAIPIVYGNGERKLAMFADPDCPYCQSMEGMMDQRGAALNATVYVFMWPLSIHPHSNEKADYLWCEPDRASAWTSWMVFANATNTANPQMDEEDVWKAWLKATHRPSEPLCKTPSPREDVRALAQKYGMTVTPTLIFENGGAKSGGTDVHGLENGWNYVYKGVVPQY